MDDHQFLNHRSMHGADIQWPRGLKGRLLKTLIACDASSCFVLPRSAIQSSGCTEEGKEYGTTVPQNNITPSPQRIWHQRPLQNFYKNMAPSPLTPSQSI